MPASARRKSFLGFLSLVLGIGLFSTIEICAKVIASQAVIPPAVMVFLRFAVTGLILAAIGLPAYRRSRGAFTGHDWKIFFLNGTIGVTLSIGLFHLAILMFANASSAAVVFSANAVFTILFARFINHEAWTLPKWLALVCGLTGILFFMCESGAPGLGALGAIAVMALAAMCFAFGVCLTKREVAKYGPCLFMGMSSLCGSLCALPFALAALPPQFLQEVRNCWPALTYMILAGTTLAYLFYYIGLKYVSAFVASMTFFLKPVLACFLAVLWLQEKMNVWTVAGTLIIMCALLLTLIRKGNREQ